MLIGPSGCGKTTTLRMMNRLIEPTAGTITVEGTDIRELAPTELRRGIGYVIQQIGLFPHRNVADNIATVPKLVGWDKARIRARVDELVDLVGLERDLLRRYPVELSGGQQQRVGVARALAADPPVLLMDEPFGAVDPIVRGRLQDELLDLQRRVQKTIVLVTHDLDEAIRLGDEIALLNIGGVLEQFGPPDDLLAEPGRRVRRAVPRRRPQPQATGTHPGGRPDSGAGPGGRRRRLGRPGPEGGARRGARVGRCGRRRPVPGVGSTSTRWRTAVRSPNSRRDPPAAQLSPEATLREALEEIMTARSAAAVISDDGRFVGVMTLEQIRQGLAA